MSITEYYIYVCFSAKMYLHSCLLAIATKFILNNTHICFQIHILCYIAHVRFMVKAIVESQAELRDELSTILPPEMNGALNTAVMEQTIDMFRSAFTETGEDKLDFADVKSSSPFIDRLKILVHSRIFDNDRDLAVVSRYETDCCNLHDLISALLLFLLLRSQIDNSIVCGF